MDFDKIISANEAKFDKWDAQFDYFIEAQFEVYISTKSAPSMSGQIGRQLDCRVQ